MTRSPIHPSTPRLFQIKLLRNAVNNYQFPSDLEAKHQVIQRWIETDRNGTLAKISEVQLHGEFLGDIFRDVLGYGTVTQSQGKTWELYAEASITDKGGRADAALGMFSAVKGGKGNVKLEGRIVAPIELKGARTNLDDKQGKNPSPIDQGWSYANHTPDCRWVIVSNYRELRLYSTSESTKYYQLFTLEDLADFYTFKQFYFLLCRQNFLPHGNELESRIDGLLRDSEQQEQAITKELYNKYANVRNELIAHFRRDVRERAEIQHLADAQLVEKAQLAIDRILFIAFCEDRGLLPKYTLKKAYEHDDPYFPRAIWDNYKKIFEWINVGNPKQAIHGYNGGLFRHDSLLDDVFGVPDIICRKLKEIADFDFDVEVSVDVLGHIFEQSVTDLEEIRAEGEGKEYTKKERKKGQQKIQGIFYTPPQITKYIIDISLSEYLERHKPLSTSVEISDWEAYRDWLKHLKIVDPACGSGAFLIAAFNRLLRAYEEVNRELAILKGADYQIEDGLDRAILNGNLYGVDLSQESVEITKLSLWLQTAQQGKTLIDLNENIKVGNSIVDDGSLCDFPFNWQDAFPEVFARGGFDVVLGNPPYVRQELLTPIKPYLQSHYQSYDGVADLYTYFYEKGVQILKPDGILCYIVTNKWLRSGYGEGLRRFFTQNSVFEKIIDFGHAPIFKEADVFPCIVSLRKRSPSIPLAKGEEESSAAFARGAGEENSQSTKRSPSIPLKKGEEENSPPFSRKAAEEYSPPFTRGAGGDLFVQICAVPREECLNANLTQYVSQNSFPVVWSRFSEKAWSLEPPAVEELMQKIKQVGIPLKDFAGVKPYRGITTGFNDAFWLDDNDRNNLIKNDPKSSELIKPFLRGQDIKRWIPEWENMWIIFPRRDIDIDSYPAIKMHLQGFRPKLEARSGKQLWWQYQAFPAFYELFDAPKIIYQVIQFHPQYAFDDSGMYENDKTYFLPTGDLYLLGCLNSSVMWWYAWRFFGHMKDDALNPANFLMESLPIAQPTPTIRAEVEEIVSRLIEITKRNQDNNREVSNWIQSTHKIPKLGQKLENFALLSQIEFVEAIRQRIPKISGDLSPKGLKGVENVYQEYALPMQSDRAESNRLEHRLSDLINQAYQLTPTEIELMWRTAPPRMPISQP
jgi:type I restriction-modification system DNA methylase subunit